MHARGIAGSGGIPLHKLLILQNKISLFPVRLAARVPGLASQLPTRKNLRTYLSTEAVDFFETHGMKHLALDFAIQREFLEHYKSDASRHSRVR